MSFELMAPLMFLALVVLLLLGYPVAFALAANGLLFAIIGIQAGFFDFVLLQALPNGCSAFCRTRHCWPFRSHLHGPDPGNAAAWPRPCSIPSASCSAPCAAGSPTR